jgi:hypothetical protein
MKQRSIRIYINRIKNQDKRISRKGKNPLDSFTALVEHPI